MARDTREILSAIRVEVQEKDGPNVTTKARVFGPDDRDELAQALSPEQGQRLLESGALNGDWHFSGVEAEPLPPQPSEAELLRAELAEMRAMFAEMQAAKGSKPAKPPAD